MNSYRKVQVGPVIQSSTISKSRPLARSRALLSALCLLYSFGVYAGQVPEILSLRQGETVPREVFERYDSRQIGAAITEKIFREQEESISTKVKVPFIDFEKEATVQLAFFPSQIASIAKYGFLNQHQINQSGGQFSPAARAKREDEFLGFSLEAEYVRGIENPVNRVRPKYAYLGLKNIPLEIHPMHRGDSGLPQNYGTVFAEFKAEVMKRSTFTMDDSYNKKRGDFHTIRFRDSNPNGPTSRAKAYIEAQIWGELTIEDVEIFIVNCDGFAPITLEALAQLRKLGKPVRSCFVDRLDGGSPTRIRDAETL